MSEKLSTEIQYLKGVGPRLAMTLKKVKLHTVEDVLWYFPRRYEDRRNLPELMLLRPGDASTVRGKIIDLRTRPTRGGKVLIKAILSDGTGEVDLVWFNQPWVSRELQKHKGEILAFGMVKEASHRRLEISSPEYEKIDEDDESDEFARLTPIYKLADGVSQWVVRRAAKSAVEYFASQVVDPLPETLRKKAKIKSLSWCLTQMHQPDSTESQETARRRLALEEFLYLQLEMQMKRRESIQEVGISFPIRSGESLATGSTLFAAPGDESHDLPHLCRAMLPFELTGAQTRVIDEIWNDMERPIPMNRLLQGDVGSGKTAVAACAVMGCVHGGYQAAIMAPTEILAEQHYYGLKKLFDPMGLETTLLVGKLSAKDKKQALAKIAGGESHVVVGTQALIQDAVSFHKLGLVIIDEQHRFGVMQRLELRKKAGVNPDVLVMTATPIPRTLTMSLYGDLDLSVIDELPPGRRPIKTHKRPPERRDSVYATVRDLVKEGRQAYFVCPLVSESEKMQTQAAEDLHYRLSNQVFSDLNVGLLHGQMKSAEKEAVMDDFRQGKLDILVSTVVIEVGVDVPNASIMVIEDANRFGLSQLHQLRGRVGRGSTQSYCILIANETTVDSSSRLRVMVETSDGFRIAEEDLRIRGPGDIIGTRQSGEFDFKVANLIQDGVLLEQAKQLAESILDDDPNLSKRENQMILQKVRERRSDQALVAIS